MPELSLVSSASSRASPARSLRDRRRFWMANAFSGSRPTPSRRTPSAGMGTESTSVMTSTLSRLHPERAHRMACCGRMVSGPLAHAPFRWLLAGRTIGILGNAIAPVALAFAVLDLTGSTTDLGIVVAARSVMNVLLLLYGGVLADRLPRRLLLVGAASASAVTQALVAALVLAGGASVWSLAVLSAVNGAVAGIGFPASLAMVSQTVPPAMLASTNASLRLGLNASNVVGVSIGGLLVATVGPGWGIAVDAATFALSALCFARVDVPFAGVAKAAGTVLADLREGWGEFRSRTWVWVIVAQFGVVNAALAGAGGVLGPVVADQSIGRKAYGLVLAASTLGLVAGSVVALRYQPRRALLFGTSAVLVTALPPLALALTPTVALLMVAFLHLRGELRPVRGRLGRLAAGERAGRAARPRLLLRRPGVLHRDPPRRGAHGSARQRMGCPRHAPRVRIRSGGRDGARAVEPQRPFASPPGPGPGHSAGGAPLPRLTAPAGVTSYARVATRRCPVAVDAAERDRLLTAVTSNDAAREAWESLDDEQREVLWSWLLAPRWSRTRRSRAERTREALASGWTAPFGDHPLDSLLDPFVWLG
jgi:MFS family permease